MMTTGPDYPRPWLMVSWLRWEWNIASRRTKGKTQ